MANADDLAGSYGAKGAAGYAGDVTPEATWRMLGDRADAVLVDVRTTAEWAYVGGPDLSSIGKPTVYVQWQAFPSMQVDPDFVARVAAQIGDPSSSAARPLLFLCRSGVRSAAAARAMTAAGWSNCFNIVDGFEGPPDQGGHRGAKAGWKASGLPWVQK